MVFTFFDVLDYEGKEDVGIVESDIAPCFVAGILTSLVYLYRDVNGLETSTWNTKILEVLTKYYGTKDLSHLHRDVNGLETSTCTTKCIVDILTKYYGMEDLRVSNPQYAKEILDNIPLTVSEGTFVCTRDHSVEYYCHELMCLDIFTSEFDINEICKVHLPTGNELEVIKNLLKEDYTKKDRSALSGRAICVY